MSRRAFLLALLSGLLLAASFPPLDIGWLAWVAFVPLLIAIDGVSSQRAFALGYLAGAAAFVPILAWMRVFGILAWVLLAAYLSLYPAVFAGLVRWVSDRRAPAVAMWSAALIWTGLEYLRSLGVFGFPWALVGLTQYRYPAIIQVAKIAGVFGVSFIVVLVAAAVAPLLTSRRIAASAAAVLAAAIPILWGMTQIGPLPAGTLRIAALQPNVPARVKFDPLYAPDHMRTLARQVDEAGRAGADLVVMPETAIPYNLFGKTGVLSEVGTWARRARATLIASSLEGGISNIAVSIAPSGQPLARYDKVRLVAFGEYGVRPGRRHEPLWTPSGPVGIAICFESIFPDVARALVRNGAEIVAVITNDGWFDGTAGAAQHAAHAVLRAVETGRWVVQAGNTGITMLVDPAGHIRDRLRPLSAGVLIGQASMLTATTLYTRVGDAFAQAVLLASLILAAPRLRSTFAPQIRTPVFRQLAAAAVLPLVAVWFLLGSASSGLWPGVLLVFVIVLSMLRPLSRWGFRIRGLPLSMILGTAVVLVLWGGLALAFRAYSLPTNIPTPEGGWVVGILRQLVIGLVVECWLRGLVFTPAEAWRGWPTAVALGVVLGMVLQRGLSAEGMAWAMITGVAFGLIRARTGNAVGLVVPHTLGNLLFSMVALVR